MNSFDIGRCHFACSAASLFVAIWILVDLSSELSPRCDPLTFVPLYDHEQDWHLMTCWVTVVSSVVVARTIR